MSDATPGSQLLESPFVFVASRITATVAWESITGLLPPLDVLSSAKTCVWRPRVQALTHADLWVAGEGPPEQLPILDHHECGICHHVKSHPVSNSAATILFSLVTEAFISPSDGQGRRDELLNVAHKKRRLDPATLDDNLAQWIPVPDDNFTEDAARAAPPQQTVNSQILGKRKEYASTVERADVLMEAAIGDFLDEIVRHEGLGDYTTQQRCAHCTEEWDGEFWISCTLKSIGLVYQLGHGGFPCPAPDTTVHKLVVIEVVPIIHEINVAYCKCSKSDDADNLEQLLRNAWYPATVTDPGTCSTFRSLETYRLYNVLGNMNVRDFITSLERMTDASAASGMTWLPDRYKQFQRMARQWAFLMRLKRAGRAHDPREGRNLPDGWQEVDPKYQFLYMLCIAVDANFRLKNRIRTNEIDDPSLGPGWGYWVEASRYRKHLRKYVNETEISTCIAFAALLQKDTRLTTGLRVSGVGGCKGERYANMDFIWKLNLAERIQRLPSDMRLPLDTIKIQYALPVWHAGSHNEECQNDNSLSFKHFMTKDAGRGVRADTMEGKIDNHNYLKNVGQGDALQRKLLVAIAERDRQVAAFSEVSRTVEKDVKREWRTKINKWLEDPSESNPYTLSRKGEWSYIGPVRVEVHKDEAALTAGGKAPLHGRSATAFLVAGIQIEDAQQRIVAELKGTALVAADRENKIQEWRHALLVKIAKFRTLQKIYMPGAARALEAAEGERDADVPPPKAEAVKLLMPSEMTPDNDNDTLRGSVLGLVDMEAKLRVAQCENSLASLRSRLHAKRHLITFRNSNVTGQVQSTKARTLIEQGRAALVALKGAAAYSHLRELHPDDVRLDGDNGESDVAARKKLAMMGAGRGARAPRNAPGMSKRVMSWIWTAPGALDEVTMHDHTGRMVKGARKEDEGWCEEVMLLREEMRRVLRYLEWQARWWRDRVAPRDDLTVAGGSGGVPPLLGEREHEERQRKEKHAATRVEERETKPTIPVSPVLNHPRLLRPISYIPETIAHLPPYSLDEIKAVWREAYAPLYHCRCTVCERAMTAQQAAQGGNVSKAATSPATTTISVPPAPTPAAKENEEMQREKDSDGSPWVMHMARLLRALRASSSSLRTTACTSRAGGGSGRKGLEELTPQELYWLQVEEDEGPGAWEREMELVDEMEYEDGDEEERGAFPLAAVRVGWTPTGTGRNRSVDELDGELQRGGTPPKRACTVEPPSARLAKRRSAWRLST
ncbi:hypothetical protein B0H14DRAFT_3466313 [Mycena olivaceomarginata]|nr:hypothetical protein B0H14DRAFT_3466313 [Mycena olivaceomarginata]